MNNWRKILSWSDEETFVGRDYSTQPDYTSVERRFLADYVQSESGVVYTYARCKQEAKDLFEEGDLEIRHSDYDDMSIDYNSIVEN